MSDKVEVIIFGIRNEVVSSGCGCSCEDSGCGDSGCGPTQTMGEQYEELVVFLNERFDNVELKFIDITENNLAEHEDALDLLKQDYPIPYTKIDDDMVFYGGISKEAIYEELTEEEYQ